MNRDLFLAILAMDSYNRGYGEGISGLVPSGNLGKAQIINDSLALGGTPDDRLDAQSSFYAIAYDMTGASGFADGERVIAYRGTDAILGGDLLYGWTLGGGLATASQGQLAIDFYNAVRGGDLFDAHESTITTTGHSLGGGLAANDNDSGERAAA